MTDKAELQRQSRAHQAMLELQRKARRAGVPRAVLELLKRYLADHDDRVHEETGGDDAGCDCVICRDVFSLLGDIQ